MLGYKVGRSLRACVWLAADEARKTWGLCSKIRKESKLLFRGGRAESSRGGRSGRGSRGLVNRMDEHGDAKASDGWASQ